jgi:hypothetical protein
MAEGDDPAGDARRRTVILVRGLVLWLLILAMLFSPGD